MASKAVLFITLAIFNFMCIASAFDPRPLLDFCVADPTGKAPCKDPNTVTANDFFFSGLLLPGNTTYNEFGVGNFAYASAATVPGFNTLGLTFGGGEIAPNGYFPPHSHPRSSEVLYVLEGAVEVGFITSYPDYKYYSKILNKGDVFIIPVGLIHTVRNVAQRKAVVVAADNSQNPGFIFVPNNVFGAKPAINSSYLAEAFKLDENTVKDLQAKSWY